MFCYSINWNVIKYQLVNIFKYDASSILLFNSADGATSWVMPRGQLSVMKIIQSFQTAEDVTILVWCKNISHKTIHHSKWHFWYYVLPDTHSLKNQQYQITQSPSVFCRSGWKVQLTWLFSWTMPTMCVEPDAPRLVRCSVWQQSVANFYELYKQNFINSFQYRLQKHCN